MIHGAKVLLSCAAEEELDLVPGKEGSSVPNSSYELIILKIRAIYEQFLNKNTSKIRAKIREKKRVNSTRDIFTIKVRKSALFLF